MTTYTYKILFKTGEEFNITSKETLTPGYCDSVQVLRLGYNMELGFFPMSEVKGIVLLSKNQVEEKV
jgi:CRISPR/Cas system CMR subunit Cmr6 (Cas7 group RAMP superfamily)